MGDAGLNSGATRYQLPIISPPTFSDNSAPYEPAPVVFGKYAQERDQAYQNRTNIVQEISFSVVCSPTVLDLLCLFAFEDGDGTNQLLGTYSPPAWTNGADTNYSATIDIGGGGHSATYPDNRYRGCILTSLEITHDISSEGGKPIANCTFMTGYQPTQVDDLTDTGGTDDYTPSLLTGESATNFTSWVEADTYFEVDDADHRIHPYNYAISLSRDVQRVGCVDYTNFEPDGYVMAGQWDVSGSITFKRDENWQNMKSLLYDSANTIFRIGDGSNWDCYIQGRVEDGSIDTGNPELRNTISMRGLGNGANAIVSLSM
jgi:hypothetical protein